jgi:hypothetical protein
MTATPQARCRTPVPEEITEMIATFVVWLASREPDALVRTRHHRHVENYLRWCHATRTPPDRGRARYEELLGHGAVPEHLGVALDRLAEHSAILALTRVAEV